MYSVDRGGHSRNGEVGWEFGGDWLGNHELMPWYGDGQGNASAQGNRVACSRYKSIGSDGTENNRLQRPRDREQLSPSSQLSRKR